MPAEIPVDFWGDACVLVPWALYWSRGDLDMLRQFYPMMKKYVDACARQTTGYIWDTDYKLHFGDWVAPDVPAMEDWQKRSKWTATASLFHTSDIVSQTAGLLEMDADAARYRALCRNVAKAYTDIFTDGNGKLLEEFQTAYALPLAFGMFDGEIAEKAAGNLARLVEQRDYCIGTGFPGTPFILFALADHGYADVAYKMLLNTKCPSWLYEVEHGATTIWERWDGLDEDGNCPIGESGLADMVSYNHYASGAVGEFLYRRVAGLEPLEPGYRRFRAKPVLGGRLTSAGASVETPYGTASVSWDIADGQFTLTVQVPTSCECEAFLPDGQRYEVNCGTHVFQCAVS